MNEFPCGGGYYGCGYDWDINEECFYLQKFWCLDPIKYKAAIGRDGESNASKKSNKNENSNEEKSDESKFELAKDIKDRDDNLRFLCEECIDFGDESWVEISQETEDYMGNSGPTRDTVYEKVVFLFWKKKYDFAFLVHYTSLENGLEMIEKQIKDNNDTINDEIDSKIEILFNMFDPQLYNRKQDENNITMKLFDLFLDHNKFNLFVNMIERLILCNTELSDSISNYICKFAINYGWKNEVRRVILKLLHCVMKPSIDINGIVPYLLFALSLKTNIPVSDAVSGVGPSKAKNSEKSQKMDEKEEEGEEEDIDIIGIETNASKRQAANCWIDISAQLMADLMEKYDLEGAAITLKQLKTDVLYQLFEFLLECDETAQSNKELKERWLKSFNKAYIANVSNAEQYKFVNYLLEGITDESDTNKSKWNVECCKSILEHRMQYLKEQSKDVEFSWKIGNATSTHARYRAFLQSEEKMMKYKRGFNKIVEARQWCLKVVCNDAIGASKKSISGNSFRSKKYPVSAVTKGSAKSSHVVITKDPSYYDNQVKLHKRNMEELKNIESVLVHF